LPYDGRVSILTIPVGQFGNKFRKAREAKKLSLDDVSNVTKIGSRMLQAIEEENFDQLPGGVFNKGFIRAYAKHLGLDSEEAVTDYLACLRQAQIDANELHAAEPRKPEPKAPVPRKPGPQYTKPALTKQGQVEVEEELPDLQLPRAEDVRPPRREHLTGERTFPWATALALVVIVVATLLWLRHSRTARTAVTNSPVSASTASAAPASPTTTPLAAANTPGKPVVSAPVSTTPSTSPQPALSQPPSQPATTSASKPSAPTLSAQPSTVKPQSTSSEPQPAATKAADIKPVARMTLVIRATETSWISVTADGQFVSQETLIAPAATTVHAVNEIQVKVGNAAGVTFLWNNQEIPAQGAESEVKTFLFDAGGIRTIP